MANPLCHFEFMTDDEDMCRAFYGSVFDWEFDSSSMPGYTLIKTGSEPGGGLMKRPDEVPSPALNVYFQVKDIDATLALKQAYFDASLACRDGSARRARNGLPGRPDGQGCISRLPLGHGQRRFLVRRADSDRGILTPTSLMSPQHRSG